MLTLIFAVLATATITALAVPWLVIGTIEPETIPAVPDRLGGLIAASRIPGRDWAESAASSRGQ